ncbi:hypothetical protein ABPG75_004845 [Micractinium tetrahymenae]
MLPVRCSPPFTCIIGGNALRRRKPLRVGASAAGGAADGAPPPAPQQGSTEGGAADALASPFPIAVLGAAALGLVQPAAFGWLSPAAATPALALTMGALGLTLRLEDFQRVLSAPGRILAGVALQYTVMPLLALAISRAMSLPTPLAIGLCILASCPGASASNVVAYLARGDVALCAALTAASALAAAAATPLLTQALLGAPVAISAAALCASTLQVVLLPMLAGAVFSSAFPKQVASLRSLAALASAALFALLCGSTAAQNAAAVLRAAPQLLASVAALHAGGFLVSYALGKALGLPKGAARTASIQAGMRNSALGAMLAAAHVGAHPLAAAPCAISACMHTVMGAALAAFWQSQPMKERELQAAAAGDAPALSHATSLTTGATIDLPGAAAPASGPELLGSSNGSGKGVSGSADFAGRSTRGVSFERPSAARAQVPAEMPAAPAAQATTAARTVRQQRQGECSRVGCSGSLSFGARGGDGSLSFGRQRAQEAAAPVPLAVARHLKPAGEEEAPAQPSDIARFLAQQQRMAVRQQYRVGSAVRPTPPLKKAVRWLQRQQQALALAFRGGGGSGAAAQQVQQASLESSPAFEAAGLQPAWAWDRQLLSIGQNYAGSQATGSSRSGCEGAAVLPPRALGSAFGSFVSRLLGLGSSTGAAITQVPASKRATLPSQPLPPEPSTAAECEGSFGAAGLQPAWAWDGKLLLMGQRYAAGQAMAPQPSIGASVGSGSGPGAASALPAWVWGGQLLAIGQAYASEALTLVPASAESGQMAQPPPLALGGAFGLRSMVESHQRWAEDWRRQLQAPLFGGKTAEGPAKPSAEAPSPALDVLQSAATLHPAWAWDRELLVMGTRYAAGHSMVPDGAVGNSSSGSNTTATSADDCSGAAAPVVAGPGVALLESAATLHPAWAWDGQLLAIGQAYASEAPAQRSSGSGSGSEGGQLGLPAPLALNSAWNGGLLEGAARWAAD